MSRNLLFILTVLLFVHSGIRAQVSLHDDPGNPPPDPSAMLDVIATDKGMLVPRVSLSGPSDGTTVPTPATSLLVYNTSSSGGLSPGYYYNSGNTVTPAWTRLMSGNTAPLSGTGDPNKVAFWTSATDLSQNTIFHWDNSGNGKLGIGTATPTADYLLTLNATGSTQRGALRIPMTGSSSSIPAIHITAGNNSARGFLYENSTGSSAILWGTGSVLSSTNIVSGYTAYRNSAGLSYGLLGISGTNASYNGTNANTYAAFLQGRTVITSESSPSSPLGVDLEVRNTTTGAAAPATVSLRQTNALATTGNVMADINFGDNRTTDAQARIRALRDAASGSATDLPTALSFWTTPDGTATLTERMRISSSGNVGIGANPVEALEIFRNGTNPVQLFHSSGVASYKLGNDGNVFKIAAMDNGYGGHTGNFGTNDVQVLSMTSTGNVGIGNVAPNVKLNVGEAIPAGHQYVYLRGYGNEPGGWKGGAAFGYTSASVIMGELGGVASIGGHAGNLNAWADLAINTSGGNVGVGIATPSTKFHTTGGVRHEVLTGSGSRFVVADDNGNLSATQSTASGIVTGSGTVNYLARWTPDGNTLGIGATWDDGSSVGIGATNPAQKLEVRDGRIRITQATGGVLELTNSTLPKTNFIFTGENGHLHARTDNAAYHVLLQTGGTNGNVGIGTFSPSYPLTVRTTTATANARSASLANAIGDPLFQLVVTRGATTNNAGDVTTQIGQTWDGGAITEGIRFLRGGTATDGAMAFVTNSGTERMRINSNGNVGIGTTTPAYSLHVGAGNGDGITIGRFNDQLGWDGSGNAPQLSIRFSGFRDVQNNFVGAKISAIRTNLCCSGLSQGTELAFFTHEVAHATGAGDANLTEKMRIGNGGNLGIGVPVPAQKLHVLGTGRFSNLGGSGDRLIYANNDGDLSLSNSAINLSNLIDGAGTTDYLARWIDANTLGIGATRDDGSNVGIGTAPANRLTIDGSNVATVPILGLRSGNNSTDFNNGAQIAFGYSGTGTYQHFIHTRHNSANSNNALDFYVSDGTQNNTVTSGSVHNMSMVSGKVGIGITAPDDLLHIYTTTPQGNSAAGGIPANDEVATLVLEQRHSATKTLEGVANAGFTSSMIDFRANNAEPQRWSVAQIHGLVDAGSGGYAGGLAFSTSPGGTTAPSDSRTQGANLPIRMLIQGNGNVGVGNVNPVFKLDVAGDIRANIASGGYLRGRLHIDDTRTVNSPPTTFDNELRVEFKQRAVVGAPGSAGFGGLMTIAPWIDNSGGNHHQLFFSNDGIFNRQGAPDAATWGSWDRVATTGIETISVADARVTLSGTWTSAGASWGFNRFTNEAYHTNCSVPAQDCNGDFVNLTLTNNQYRSVFVSSLDWSSCGYVNVEISNDGGSTFSFFKTIDTYRSVSNATPFVSSHHLVAGNLPQGANIVIRLRSTRGRFHFEGFGLSHTFYPDSPQPEMPEEYCIIVPRSRACPAGWVAREVKWDTEDNSNADAGKDGRIAWDDGSTASVRMRFCCKGNGGW